MGVGECEVYEKGRGKRMLLSSVRDYGGFVALSACRCCPPLVPYVFLEISALYFSLLLLRACAVRSMLVIGSSIADYSVWLVLMYCVSRW